MFNSLFGSRTTLTPEGWLELAHLNELDGLMTRSKERAIAIFKHSTRCGVSSMVKKGFEKEWDLPLEEIELYYLDLLQHRDISNAIAERTGVHHESPQLIVIKNGTVIHHSSHDSISAGSVREAIAS